jgi:hypothetical protein
MGMVDAKPQCRDPMLRSNIALSQIFAGPDANTMKCAAAKLPNNDGRESVAISHRSMLLESLRPVSASTSRKEVVEEQIKIGYREPPSDMSSDEYHCQCKLLIMPAKNMLASGGFRPTRFWGQRIAGIVER